MAPLSKRAASFPRAAGPKVWPVKKAAAPRQAANSAPQPRPYQRPLSPLRREAVSPPGKDRGTAQGRGEQGQEVPGHEAGFGQDQGRPGQQQEGGGPHHPGGGQQDFHGFSHNKRPRRQVCVFHTMACEAFLC